jgi:hypothetical protein
VETAASLRTATGRRSDGKVSPASRLHRPALSGWCWRAGPHLKRFRAAAGSRTSRSCASKCRCPIVHDGSLIPRGDDLGTSVERIVFAVPHPCPTGVAMFFRRSCAMKRQWERMFPWSRLLKRFDFLGKIMVLQERIELSTSPLPRECSTTELLQRTGAQALRPKRPRLLSPLISGKHSA